MEILKKIADSLMEFEPDDTVALVNEALESGLSPKQILNEGLIKGMDVVGQLFKDNEIYVPEVSMAAECLTEALEIIKPLLVEEPGDIQVKVVIGTVEGDIHDIGKSLVGVMMEGAGFKVIDLGTNVKAEEFIQAAKENDADIIGCSALLTTTMPVMTEVAALVKQGSLNKDVKVLFGGAPIYEKWALENGADGYADDASGAVQLVKTLMAK
ncbi:corrinoid protein [Alkalibacter rhizosphaerae]|uniref:Corrinoid protein n=1 Tax=Alkalibacter rhizosphaerae TaxID=2815577 RepID=A0A974XG41_9FIRM|nr:corrinoid protein [Alkalibacter rhizosphaerae]QSX09227.1 corrinoid protein [Alkalibacter rhizosphaerae]